MVARWRSFAGPFRVAGLSAIFLLLAGSLFSWEYGSLSAALTALSGHELVITPTTAEVGDVKPSEIVPLTFTLRNIGNKSVELIGLDGICSCSFAEALPIQIEPGGTRQVSLNYKAPRNVGRFSLAARFVSTSEISPVLSTRIQGAVHDER